MADLDGLLEFVKYHNLGNLPFNQVLDLWDKDIKQTLEKQIIISLLWKLTSQTSYKLWI